MFHVHHKILRNDSLLVVLFWIRNKLKLSHTSSMALNQNSRASEHTADSCKLLFQHFGPGLIFDLPFSGFSLGITLSPLPSFQQGYHDPWPFLIPNLSFGLTVRSLIFDLSQSPLITLFACFLHVTCSMNVLVDSIFRSHNRQCAGCFWKNMDTD